MTAEAEARKLRAAIYGDVSDISWVTYTDASVDCVVLDPPYMEGFFRANVKQLAHTKSDFRDRYSSGTVLDTHGLKYHAAVFDLYRRAALEAWRVLRAKGVLVVKCQDEVSNHLLAPPF